MKRSFLYLALGALALSACTSESVLEDAVKKQNVIGFENVVNKPSRAEGDEVTKQNIAKFSVFGYYITPGNDKVAVPVFNNVLVSKQTDNDWKYAGGDRYWVPGAHYYFYAYNCGNVDKLSSKFGNFAMDMENEKDPKDRVLMITDYVCDKNHQHDLLFASNTGTDFQGILGLDNNNPAVSMQFKHILSKVRAQFISEFPNDYTIEISNVYLSNFHNKGTYNPSSLNNGGWESLTGALSKGVEGFEPPTVFLLDTKNAENPASPITAQNDDSKPIKATTPYAYVIPYEYPEPTLENGSDWVFIKFDLIVKNKGEIVLKKENMTGHFNPKWEKGYTYTYNIVVSGSVANLQLISFTTTEDEDWNEGKDEGHTITIEK